MAVLGFDRSLWDDVCVDRTSETAQQERDFCVDSFGDVPRFHDDVFLQVSSCCSTPFVCQHVSFESVLNFSDLNKELDTQTHPAERFDDYIGHWTV